MSKIPNTILVIGGDHVNTLAVVRDLGRHKCKMEILVHGEFSSLKEVNLAKSRFAKGVTSIAGDTEEAILQWIRAHMKKEKKVILFPCSDLAAYSIDLHYTELSEYCYMPGFKDKPGMVAELMDKYNQKKYAEKNHILMAETRKINLSDPDSAVHSAASFPCILKPEISANGAKDDIRICTSADEYRDALNEFKEKHYEEVLWQKFLKKEYELCLFGCAPDCNKNVRIGGCLKKTLEWPVDGGGSVTYGKFITDTTILEHVYKVADIIKRDGYIGQYDIEFLVCEDGIYLNEINFRHSGNGFALIDNGISAPFYYCLSCLKHAAVPKGKKEPENGKTMMYEIDFLKHRKAYNLSMWKWMKLFFTCSSYSMISRSDFSGSLAFLSERFRNLLHKLSLKR